MANKTLLQEMDDTPPQICFADFDAGTAPADGDFGPSASVDLRKGTDTQVQLALESLADGAARQSDKADLGEHRAAAYAVRAAFELAATPTAGDIIEIYWAPSSSSTEANGNPGSIEGDDKNYTGYSANLAASVKQLVYIGAFVCTEDATIVIQIAEVGTLVPTERYGSLVVKNESAAAFHSDDAECHVVFDPIVDELQ